jgi:hypothetical protein
MGVDEFRILLNDIRSESGMFSDFLAKNMSCLRTDSAFNSRGNSKKSNQREEEWLKSISEEKR